MGQEDYFLREVEKIGVLLRALIGRLVSNHENLSVTSEKSFEETAGSLLNEAGFDLTRFLKMTPADASEYISTFKGVNTENMELLADLIFNLGVHQEQGQMTLLLEKSLLLLEMCNENDKTFSFEREAKIGEIKSLLEDNGRA